MQKEKNCTSDKETLYKGTDNMKSKNINRTNEKYDFIQNQINSDMIEKEKHNKQKFKT